LFSKILSGDKQSLIEFSLKEHLCIFDIQEKQIEESKITFSFVLFLTFEFFLLYKRTEKPNEPIYYYTKERNKIEKRNSQIIR